MRTRPTNYIVGKLWLISNFRRKRVPKISSVLKSSASHHKPRRSSVYHPITSPGLRPLPHYLAGSPSSVEELWKSYWIHHGCRQWGLENVCLSNSPLEFPSLSSMKRLIKSSKDLDLSNVATSPICRAWWVSVGTPLASFKSVWDIVFPGSLCWPKKKINYNIAYHLH